METHLQPHFLDKSTGPPFSKPTCESKKQLRVLFLRASSGGGHDGVYRGILANLRGQFDLESVAVDVYEVRQLCFLRSLARIRFYSCSLWSLLLTLTDSVRICRILFAGIPQKFRADVVKRSFAGCSRFGSQDFCPDLIIAVHHLAGQYLEDVRNSFHNKPKTILCITDYRPHSWWIAKADAYLVCCGEAKRRLLRRGVTDRQIGVTEFLPSEISFDLESFDSKSSALLDCRSALSLVIASGSDGTNFKRVTKLLRKLDKQISRNLKARLRPIDIKVVCGRNRGALRNIKKLKFNNFQIRPYGYVKNFPEMLLNSDVAVLRAGPQSLTEAALTETTVFIFGHHAHEFGSSRHFVKNRLAFYLKSTDELADTLVGLMSVAPTEHSDRRLAISRERCVRQQTELTKFFENVV